MSIHTSEYLLPHYQTISQNARSTGTVSGWQGLCGQASRWMNFAFSSSLSSAFVFFFFFSFFTFFAFFFFALRNFAPFFTVFFFSRNFSHYWPGPSVRNTRNGVDNSSSVPIGAGPAPRVAFACLIYQILCAICICVAGYPPANQLVLCADVSGWPMGY